MNIQYANYLVDVATVPHIGGLALFLALWILSIGTAIFIRRRITKGN